MTKFSNAGATIPEIDDHTQFSPRQLMKPKPKLLVAPGKPEEDSYPKNNRENEEEYLEQLVRKVARELSEDEKGSNKNGKK